MLSLKVGNWRLEKILLNSFRLEPLFLADVDNIVSRLGVVATICVIEHLRLLNNVDSVVVILAPNSLLVVLDVTVVMTTLSCAIMNAHSMQVVPFVMQGLILVGQHLFLSLNLQFQTLDLVFNLATVGVKHLTH